MFKIDAGLAVALAAGVLAASGGTLVSRSAAQQAEVAATAPREDPLDDPVVRTKILRNFRVIALAMHNYNSAENTLPPAAIAGKDGKPLLSWRVAILPYLEQNDLYQQFHLDEPWDSAHNKPLLEKMPAVYAPPQGVKTHKPYSTFIQVIVAKGGVFEGTVSVPWASITDEPGETLLAAEAAEAVPWTKPEDLSFPADGPLPKLGSTIKGQFVLLMVNGSVSAYEGVVNPKVLRAVISRNGGEGAVDLDRLATKVTNP